jgi:hypothetical protein
MSFFVLLPFVIHTYIILHMFTEANRVSYHMKKMFWLTSVSNIC